MVPGDVAAAVVPDRGVERSELALEGGAQLAAGLDGDNVRNREEEEEEEDASGVIFDRRGYKRQGRTKKKKTDYREGKEKHGCTCKQYARKKENDVYHTKNEDNNHRALSPAGSR